jgi:hypothetical protein
MGIRGCQARRLATISESMGGDHTVSVTPAIGEVLVLVCRLLKCEEALGLPLRPRVGPEDHHCDHRVAERPPVEHP